MEIVFAQGTEMVGLPFGGTARVVKGQHWPATDPIVQLRPELFTDDPRFGLMYTAPPPGYDDQLNELGPADDRDSADDAEQATAAPGERRNVRRPRS